MKPSGWAKAAYAFAAVASLAINFLVSGAVIALVNFLGVWAYPVIFFTGLGLVAFVFVLLIPPTRKNALSILPSLRARFESDHERRISKGFWKWMHGKGPLLLLVITTVLLGPFVGAVVARFLGLNERRAWSYMITANGVSVAFWVSVYIGALGWLRDTFMQVAPH